MLILTIETCTETSTLGLVRDGAVLAEAAFPSRHTLARRMLTRLAWLLEECGLTKRDLEAIAVSLGPGSFTGVRIGLAAAKTLAWSLRIPLVGVPTLEALAYPFRGFHVPLLAPLVNARRQQAYLALFRGGEPLQRLAPDQLLFAQEYAALLTEFGAERVQTVLLGQVDGLPSSFFTLSPGPVVPVRALVTPHALAALALQRLQRGEDDDPMTLAPIYLRGAAE